ncbi:hypothetical protein URH17368_0967 [Alicyclobacillus hesperidum URH17-3-68]|uniref:hypothetical protein n=1 Tax=Alicyclobacillus hesperidum TaxID=89784 RepID=UPI000281BE39|nr:hypothetical protein [Alicyclobacillus hesperidum]EJY56232.1 hypothetical protein URH17368_0967 [Alicyclobacillus hesperidum URH17-3-68]
MATVGMNTEVGVELFLAECDRHLTLLEASGLQLQREGPSDRLLDDMFLIVSNLINVSFRMGIIPIVYLAYGAKVILKRICSGHFEQDDYEIHMLFVLFDRMRQHLDLIQMNYIENRSEGRHSLSECIYTPSLHLNEHYKNEYIFYKMIIEDNKSLYRVYIRIRNDCIRIPTKMLAVYQAIKESGELVASLPEETELWRERVNQSEARILAYLDPLIINDLIETIFHIRDVEVCDIVKLAF